MGTIWCEISVSSTPTLAIIQRNFIPQTIITFTEFVIVIAMIIDASLHLQTFSIDFFELLIIYH